MNRRIPSAIYGAVMGLCLVFAGLAFQMEEWKARLLPLLVSSCVFILALVALIKENFGTRSAAPSSPGASESVDDADLPQYLVSGAWVMGFLIAVYGTGFLAGIALYSFSFAKTSGATWAASIALAVLTPLSVYLIFDIALGVDLYRGLLFQ